MSGAVVKLFVGDIRARRRFTRLLLGRLLPDAPNAGTARRFELVKPRRP